MKVDQLGVLLGDPVEAPAIGWKMRFGTYRLSPSCAALRAYWSAWGGSRALERAPSGMSRAACQVPYSCSCSGFEERL